MASPYQKVNYCINGKIMGKCISNKYLFQEHQSSVFVRIMYDRMI